MKNIAIVIIFTLAFSLKGDLAIANTVSCNLLLPIIFCLVFAIITILSLTFIALLIRKKQRKYFYLSLIFVSLFIYSLVLLLSFSRMQASYDGEDPCEGHWERTLEGFL